MLLKYVPRATSIVSPLFAFAIAPLIVAHGESDVEHELAMSFPVVATYQVVPVCASRFLIGEFIRVLALFVFITSSVVFVTADVFPKFPQAVSV